MRLGTHAIILLEKLRPSERRAAICPEKTQTLADFGFQEHPKNVEDVP